MTSLFLILLLSLPSSADTWHQLRIQEEEHDCANSEYNRGEFGYDRWTALQKIIAINPFPRYSGYGHIVTSLDGRQSHVEHIVSLKEAWQSGACVWDSELKKQFGLDTDNLTMSKVGLNLSKGARDIYEWKSKNDYLNEIGLCFLALKTIQVKKKYDLSIDINEKDVLERTLAKCYLSP